MTQAKDLKVLNVPAILDRNVWVENTDGQLVADRTWYERTRGRFDSLYQFHLQQKLVTEKFLRSAPPLDSLLLHRSDLTPSGWALWQSGAVDRWLNSFDRSPNKSLTNYKILEVSLAKINAAAA